MATTTFDSLGYFERLKAAGVPEPQAKVQADALREIVDDKLATKSDLNAGLLALKKDLTILNAELKHELLKWIVGLAFAQAAITVALFSIK
jgi:hypothetical protein